MLNVEIRVIGQIDQCRSEWFGGMTISPDESGKTILGGSINDQAALFGLLSMIRDLGLALTSIRVLDNENKAFQLAVESPPTGNAIALT